MSVEQHMDRCRHFTGIRTNACAAGVAYDSVRVRHEPIEYRGRTDGVTYRATVSLPCIGFYNHCGATCDKRETPTREEAEAHEAKVQHHIDDMLAGWKAVAEAASKVKAGAGTVVCPKCGGNLQWSKALLNGHVWGRCDTPDCLAWMQ